MQPAGCMDLIVDTPVHSVSEIVCMDVEALLIHSGKIFQTKSNLYYNSYIPL